MTHQKVPTPWSQIKRSVVHRYDDVNDKPVAIFANESDAAFAIKAANNFDDMVKIIEEFLELFEDDPQWQVPPMLVDRAKTLLQRTDS